ncbi:MAG: 3-oxoacyl-[acyl-carrier-protein] synthase III C-terminal domain-containing protein [bacterium]
MVAKEGEAVFGARIVGIGVAIPGTNIPGRIVTNDMIAEELLTRRERLVNEGKILTPAKWEVLPLDIQKLHRSRWGQFESDSAWIVSHTGIHTRRFLDPEFATSDLAATAGQMALRMAGWEPKDVQFVIVATVTPDFPTTPPTAAIVQEKLGIPANDDEGALEIDGFDLTCACSSWGKALMMGYALIRSGMAERILVIGADVMSRTSTKTHSLYPILADGGGAVALARLDSGDDFFGRRGFRGGLDGSLADLIVTEYGGSRHPIEDARIFDDPVAFLHLMRMAGPYVKKNAVRLLTGFGSRIGIIEQAVRKAGLDFSDLDALFVHQANSEITGPVVEKVADKGFLGIAPKNIERVGNTTSASVPTLLFEAWRDGKLKDHPLVMTVVFGGGFSWATALFWWTLPAPTNPSDVVQF